MAPKKRKKRFYSKVIYSKKYRFRSTKRDFDDPIYKRWRSQIYSRDEHTCQMPGCKYRGRNIQAHHVFKWSDYPTMRFNLMNGITLCIRCHKRVTGNEEIYAGLFLQIISAK